MSKIIQERIQDAPALSEYISSFVSDKPNEMFFPNQDLLHEFSQKSSESAKEEVPGANYFNPILDGVRAYPILDGGGQKSPPPPELTLPFSV